jgi:DNA-binding MarR family transcriptional regulator
VLVPRSLPLPTLLSQALVAHTIELDNEAEHRLPHRTTRHHAPDAGPDGPWLVSFALWANVLQYVGGEGIAVADLRARARTNQLLLSGLRRWGYVSITAPDGQPLRNPPQDESTVRPRKAARAAREVWSDLPSVIDGRWRVRLGRPAVDRLERALRAVFDGLPIDPPAFLPVIHPTQGGRLETPLPRHDTVDPLPPSAALSPLLSGVLHAFTFDFESRSRISLPISATSLRVLEQPATPVGDLPRLTGVSREANAMCAGWLERHGCAVVEPVASGRRGKVVRLTPKGERAQQKYRRLLAATEESWQSTYGADVVASLRAALEDIVGDGTYASSPLASGLVPYPDNWRSKVRRPETLPHHPMVLHRGGYPDGS